MVVVWAVVGAAAAVAAVAYGVVARRGRGRGAVEGEDHAAGRSARYRQQRYEAERHGDQGDTWQRGRESGG